MCFSFSATQDKHFLPTLVWLQGSCVDAACKSHALTALHTICHFTFPDTLIPLHHTATLTFNTCTRVINLPLYGTGQTLVGSNRSPPLFNGRALSETDAYVRTRLDFERSIGIRPRGNADAASGCVSDDPPRNLSVIALFPGKCQRAFTMIGHTDSFSGNGDWRLDCEHVFF